MKALFACLALLSGALVYYYAAPPSKPTSSEHRESTTSGMELPEPWFLLQYSLDEYAAMQPERPIIVSLGAHWCVGSEHPWRILFKTAVKSTLEESGFLCLIGDATKADELVRKEIENFSRESVPITAIFDPQKQEWELLPEVFSEEEIIQRVNSIDYVRPEERVADPAQ